MNNWKLKSTIYNSTKNLAKYVQDLYAENYITLMKEIKKMSINEEISHF